MSEKKDPHTNPITDFLAQYFRQLRFYLITGLLVWVPTLVTIWITWWLFKNVGLGTASLMHRMYEFLSGLGERYAFLGFMADWEYRNEYSFLIPLAIFLTTGFLTRYLVWRKVISTAEDVLQRIPIIKNVYSAVQQIRDTFMTRDTGIFEAVCVVQYPRKGLYSVAFITSREQGRLQNDAGRELTAIFVPTTPNPTSGFYLYLPPDDVIELDISVEDALKMVISGGAYKPEEPGPILAGSL